MHKSGTKDNFALTGAGNNADKPSEIVLTKRLRAQRPMSQARNYRDSWTF